MMAARETVEEAHSGGSRGPVAALQVVVGAFTPLALISIGGVAIYAAPVLLPLLWITANACRGAGRWYFTVLASLVAALSAWAISWGLAPSLQVPLPIAAAAATGTVFVKTWHRDLPIRTIALTLLALAALGLAGIGALAAGGDTSTREVEFEGGHP